MKTYTIRNALAVAAVGTGMAFAMSSTAQAALVYKDVNSANPGLAEQTFLNKLQGPSVTESFESYDLGNAPPGALPGPFNTNVGRFEAGPDAGDTTGSCVAPCDKIQVLDSTNTTFNGRFAVDLGGGVDTDGQWLDSNDVGQVKWTPDNIDGTYNAFGFYLMDPADQGATLSVTFDDGSSDTLTTLDDENNGQLFYLAGISSKPILNASVTFENIAGNTAGDGFGIDRVTVGKAEVPAPASLGLLGAGLLGLGAAGRRRRNQA